MKNVNIFSIKAKFPHLKQNKKPYLIGQNKNNSSNNDILSKYIFNSLSNNPFNLQKQPIKFMKKNNQLFEFIEKKIEKYSPTNFYMTGIEYFSSKNKNIKHSSSVPKFKTLNNPYSIYKNKNLRFKFKNIKNKNEKDDDSPKLRYLGNLIKFKKIKKNFKKKLKQEIIPQEKRKDYIDFINKKRNILFNPNATNQYVHDKSSDYLINSIKKNKSYYILEPNYIKKPKSPTEEVIEMRDSVPNLPFKTQKLITQIKNLFSQDYKFNYSQFNEEFYNNFENRINFLYDIYRVPIFKNNLVKVILNKEEPYGFEEWKNINVINNGMWNYLNRLKTKIQREKDEKLKKQKELELKKKEEEEKNIKNNKNRIKKNIENDKEENDKNKIIIKEEEKYSNIIMNIEKETKIKKQQYEDLYIIEEYFIHKINNNNIKVSIASEKLRYLFFHQKKNLFNKIII